MKLTVFGATGGTGLQVVDKASPLATRSGPSFAIEPLVRRALGLEVVVADVMDPAAIVKPSPTATPSSLPSAAEADAHRPVCADSSRSIIAAMDKAGSRRLVVVSGTGPFDEGEGPGMRYVLEANRQTVPQARLRRLRRHGKDRTGQRTGLDDRATSRPDRQAGHAVTTGLGAT